MKNFELEVEVQAQYSAEHSEPDQGRYFFAYTVRITNIGREPAQVISRHWIITDGHNQQEEVKGLGVVGQQPLIEPGKTFEYTSGCPLSTPVGTMQGSFLAVGLDGEPFRVPIDEFALMMSRMLH